MFEFVNVMRYPTVCKIIAVAILLRVILLVDLFDNIGLTSVLGALTLATLVPALVSMVGIWRARIWGFVAFYVFGVLLTFLFGVSLFPFVLQLLPVESRVVGLFAVNGIALALVALLHWKRPGAGSK